MINISLFFCAHICAGLRKQTPVDHVGSCSQDDMNTLQKLKREYSDRGRGRERERREKKRERLTQSVVRDIERFEEREVPQRGRERGQSVH